MNRTEQVLERMAQALGTSRDADLAEALGISRSTISMWRNRDRLPLAECATLAQERGVSLDWLVLGHGAPAPGEAPAPDATDCGTVAGPTGLAGPPGAAGAQVAEASARYRAGEDYVYLPLYGVQASAGHGAEPGHEGVEGQLAFRRQWIRDELRADPADLVLLHIEGESMEPTLRAGDVVLVDRRGAGGVPGDGIYLLRADGALLVKRVQRMAAGMVRVVSDHPAYATWDADLRAGAVEILGRVVWVGRRL